MSLRTLLIGALIGLTGLVALPASAEGVRLLRPAQGERWTAGSIARIEWAAGSGGAASSVVEWEAFLSIDDGRTYPIRVTPHLDARNRRFEWVVPRVPTRTARILLRTGDGVRERIFEMPLRFEIVDGERLPIEPVRLSIGRGERARPADRGVAIWWELAPDGSLREVAAAPFDDRLESASAVSSRWLPTVAPKSPLATLGPPPAAIEQPEPEGAAPPERLATASATPVRLAIHRFNE